jgi:hypothetical protein
VARGLSVNVRALPSTIAPATVAPTRRQVLVVTDAGAGTAATDPAKFVAGHMVRVQTDTVGDPRSLSGQAPAAQQIAAPGGQRRRSRHRCPQAMRWVAPPGTTPKQAAAYREIIAARPGFLVESLPAALAAVNAPAVNGLLGGHGQPVPEAGRRPARWRLPRSWPPTHPPADRLEPVSTQAHTVVSWAEEQMGKPYQWGQPGRAASTAPG